MSLRTRFWNKKLFFPLACLAVIFHSPRSHAKQETFDFIYLSSAVAFSDSDCSFLKPYSSSAYDHCTGLKEYIQTQKCELRENSLLQHLSINPFCRLYFESDFNVKFRSQVQASEMDLYFIRFNQILGLYGVGLSLNAKMLDEFLNFTSWAFYSISRVSSFESSEFFETKLKNIVSKWWSNKELLELLTLDFPRFMRSQLPIYSLVNSNMYLDTVARSKYLRHLDSPIQGRYSLLKSQIIGSYWRAISPLFGREESRKSSNEKYQILVKGSADSEKIADILGLGLSLLNQKRIPHSVPAFFDLESDTWELDRLIVVYPRDILEAVSIARELDRVFVQNYLYFTKEHSIEIFDEAISEKPTTQIIIGDSLRVSVVHSFDSQKKFFDVYYRQKGAQLSDQISELKLSSDVPSLKSPEFLSDLIRYYEENPFFKFDLDFFSYLKKGTDKGTFLPKEYEVTLQTYGSAPKMLHLVDVPSRVIGSGKTKEAKLVFDLETMRPYARLNLNSPKHAHHEIEVYQFLERVGFPDGVSKLLAWEEMEEVDFNTGNSVPNFNFFFSYVPTDLFEFMNNNRNYHIDSNLSFQYSIGFLNGISNLHKRGVAHLDIKAENILVRNVSSDLDHFSEITDLGSANFNFPVCDMIGTPGYVPPEVFENISKKDSPCSFRTFRDGELADFASTGMVLLAFIFTIPEGSTKLMNEIYQIESDLIKKIVSIHGSDDSFSLSMDDSRMPNGNFNDDLSAVKLKWKGFLDHHWQQYEKMPQDTVFSSRKKLLRKLVLEMMNLEPSQRKDNIDEILRILRSLASEV